MGLSFGMQVLLRAGVQYKGCGRSVGIMGVLLCLSFGKPLVACPPSRAGRVVLVCVELVYLAFGMRSSVVRGYRKTSAIWYAGASVRYNGCACHLECDARGTGFLR